MYAPLGTGGPQPAHDKAATYRFPTVPGGTGTVTIDVNGTTSTVRVDGAPRGVLARRWRER